MTLSTRCDYIIAGCHVDRANSCSTISRCLEMHSMECSVWVLIDSRLHIFLSVIFPSVGCVAYFTASNKKRTHQQQLARSFRNQHVAQHTAACIYVTQNQHIIGSSDSDVIGAAVPRCCLFPWLFILLNIWLPFSPSHSNYSYTIEQLFDCGLSFRLSCSRKWREPMSILC